MWGLLPFIEYSNRDSKNGTAKNGTPGLLKWDGGSKNEMGHLLADGRKRKTGTFNERTEGAFGWI